MTNILIALIAAALFIGLALAGVVYIGPRVIDSRVEAEATNYLYQSSQISKAIQDYASDHGRLPLDGSRDPIDILVAEKYMKYAPEGGATKWKLDAGAGALITPVPEDGDRAQKVCVAARVKASMPDPEKVLKCDGSDAPGGKLTPSDPCCLM